MAHPQIAAFARLAKENSRPTRLLAGQKTLLSRTMHTIRYDTVNDEIIVTNPFAQAILVFRGHANGEEAPIRVIQGPHTQLQGSTGAGMDRLDVDNIHNEIVVPVLKGILVFPRDANGDVAPIRSIRGPDTQVVSTGDVAVDPVHNLIIHGGGERLPGQPPGAKGGILMFNRTDEGNVKPRAVIGGPKLGEIRIAQMQTYPPKGWIVAAQQGDLSKEEPEGTYVGVWSINDNGDVLPRWKIGGPKSTLKRPRGVALDPKHKEIVVADMRLNSVLTYYFPEIF